MSFWTDQATELPKAIQVKPASSAARFPFSAGVIFALIAASSLVKGGHHPLIWLWGSALLYLTAVGVFWRAKRGPRLTLSARLLLGPLVLLVLGAVVQMFWLPPAAGYPFAVDPAIAALRLSGLIVLILIVFAWPDEVMTTPMLRNVAYGLVCIVAANAAFGFALTDIGTGPQAGLRGGFANRNSIATFLAIGLCLGLGLALSGERAHTNGPVWTLRQAALQLLLLCILAALVATQSRMGVMAGLIGASAVYLPMVRHLRVANMLLILLATSAAIGVFGSHLITRFDLLGQDWAFRKDFYEQVVQLIRAAPPLGVGADRFALAFEAVHRPPVDPGFVWDRTHSTYLKIWAEMGLFIGSAPLLFGLVGAGLMVFSPKGRAPGLEAGALGALVAAGLHATVDFGLEIYANQLLLTAVLALAARSRALPSYQKGKR